MSQSLGFIQSCYTLVPYIQDSIPTLGQHWPEEMTLAQHWQATGKNCTQCIASANQIAAWCYVAIV